MIELFLWKWGLYILIIYSFIANACTSANKFTKGYWINEKPYKGTIQANRDHKRPYWQCVGNNLTNILDCNRK